MISTYSVAGLCVLAFIFGQPVRCLEMNVWPWTCIVISGISSIALSHVLYYTAIKRIGATIPQLVLLLHPFLVLAISSVIFSEYLNGLQWLFGMVLLTGSALAIWSQRHLRPRPGSNDNTGKGM